MCVIPQTALIGAPFANVRAQVADLRRKSTVASNRLDAELADVDAFPTTVRTVIEDLFSDHLVQTTFAINDALMTRINAGRRRIQCRFISRHTTPPYSDEPDRESALHPMCLMNNHSLYFNRVWRDRPLCAHLHDLLGKHYAGSQSIEKKCQPTKSCQSK